MLLILKDIKRYVKSAILSFWLARIFLQNNPLYPPLLRGNQKDCQAGMTNIGKSSLCIICYFHLHGVYLVSFCRDQGQGGGVCG